MPSRAAITGRGIDLLQKVPLAMTRLDADAGIPAAPGIFFGRWVTCTRIKGQYEAEKK